jgi:hypothetical protein
MKFYILKDHKVIETEDFFKFAEFFNEKSKLIFKDEKHCVNCLHLDELELNCTVKSCKFKGITNE